MALHVKTASGGWKNTTAHVKVNGAWKQVSQIYVRTNGAWKALWSYSWITGGWSSCSASCGGGTQTRTVTCQRSDGVSLPDGFCAGITKPNTSTSCNTQTCYTYSWYSGSYGSCSVYCGNGTKTRSVYCKRNDGSQVADSYCAGSKPTASTSCSFNCYWSYGNYGACSTSCGEGTKTRTASCMSNYTGSYTSVSTSYCTSYNGTASTSGSCSSCSACYFNEAATVNAQVKNLNAIRFEGRSNWTYAQTRAGILGVFSSVQAWWNANGVKSGVCPWNSRYCCQTNGYTYYP